MSTGRDLIEREENRLQRRKRARDTLRAARRRLPKDALLNAATLGEALGMAPSTYEARMSFAREGDPFTAAEAIVIANRHLLSGSERAELILALSGSAEPGGSGAIAGHTVGEAEREIAQVRISPVVEPAVVSSETPVQIVRAESPISVATGRRSTGFLAVAGLVASTILLVVGITFVRSLALPTNSTVEQLTRAIDALRASEGRVVQAAGTALEFGKDVYLNGSAPDQTGKQAYLSPKPGDELVFRISVRNPIPGSLIRDARLRDRLSQKTGLANDEAMLVAQDGRQTAQTFVNLPDGYRLAYVPNSTRVYAFNDATGTSIPDVNGVAPLVAGALNIGDVAGDTPQGPQGNGSHWYVYRARVVDASVPMTEPAPRLGMAFGVASLNRNSPFDSSQRPAPGDVVVFKLALNQEIGGAVARDIGVSGSMSVDRDIATASVFVRSSDTPTRKLETRIFLPPQTAISYVPGSTAIVDHYARSVHVTDFAGASWPLESPQGLRIDDLHEPFDDERFVIFQFVVAIDPTHDVPDAQEVQFAIEMMNLTAGGGYGRDVAFQAGDTVRFRIGVKNLGARRVGEVSVRATIGGAPLQIAASAEADESYYSTGLLLGSGRPFVLTYRPGTTALQLGDGPLTTIADAMEGRSRLSDQGILTALPADGLERRYVFEAVVAGGATK